MIYHGPLNWQCTTIKKWKQFGYQAQQQDLQNDLNAKFDLSFKSNNTKLNVLKNNAKKYKIRVKIKCRGIPNEYNS